MINDIKLPKESEDQEYSSTHPPPTMRIIAVKESVISIGKC
jgi:hypothetical protein